MGLPDGVAVNDFGGASTAESVIQTKRAQQQLGQALGAMADAFCLYDADDRLVIYNTKYVEYNPHIADLITPGASFAEMLRIGIARGGFEMGSRSADEFFEWRVRQHRHPDAPYDVQLSNGRWMRVHEQRTEDGGIVGIRSDITELKARETHILEMSQQLRRRNVQFDTALNNMVQGLCMFDSEQRLIVCNGRYLEMYGFSADVVKPGITLREIMKYSVSLGNYSEAEAERAIAARPSHAAMRQRSVLEQSLSDGRVIGVMHEPMEDGGSVATYEDITARKLAERQLLAAKEEAEARGKALKQANADLTEKSRELAAHRDQLEDTVKERTQELEQALVKEKEYSALHRDFVTMASHEFRTPLTIIDSSAQRIAARMDKMTPDYLQKRLSKIRDAVARMTGLIESTLSSSRLERGRISVTPRTFCFSDLIVDVCGRQQDIAPEHSIEVHVGDEELDIAADQNMLDQVFTNLLSNAVKYSAKGSPVQVRLWVEDDEAVVAVRDSGVGIPTVELPRVFEKFFRATTSTGTAGTGIGLHVSKSLVELHGGSITASSIEGEGSTFLVRLPLEYMGEAGGKVAGEQDR